MSRRYIISTDDNLELVRNDIVQSRQDFKNESYEIMVRLPRTIKLIKTVYIKY